MAYRKTVAVLVLDAERKKCSFNGGPWINLKGCISMKRFQEIVEQQKREDEKKDQGKKEDPKKDEGKKGDQTQSGSYPPQPPSDPPQPPTDRDGYWVCDQGTWHFCTTYPPYEVYDSEVPC